MKSLVVYDSAFGNTEQIARAIGGALSDSVEVRHIEKLDPSSLAPIDFLFVGSPTWSGKPTKSMGDFLSRIPESALKHTRVAAFDTRYSSKLAGIFGHAADKIANALRAKGAALASPPEGFYVKGKKGPLQDGEPERAAIWAKETVGTLKPASVGRS